MAKLNRSLKDEIETISFNYTKKLLGGRIGVVFYDMTTIYFEASEPDDFRVPGFSKEGKHQNPQVLLGLLVGKNGYPIGCELFEGNTFEGHTLIPVLERYSKRLKIKKPIVVADSGLLSKANIEQLPENGYEFIIGARIKNEATSVKKQVIKIELQNGQFAIIRRTDRLKLHIGYSDKRAKKDRFNKDRELKKLEKNLASGKLTKANINNRGYNNFLKLEGKISINIDNEKLEQDQLWDGLKGYLANTTLQSSNEVDKYTNLWKIEKAFRISKTDFKIRPVYHRLKERTSTYLYLIYGLPRL